MANSFPVIAERLDHFHRLDEARCVAALVADLQQLPIDKSAVFNRAASLVTILRQKREGSGVVEHLLHQYSLSSQEGVALMCLAEALLRIPDTGTMDRLIRDKILQGDWQTHLGASDSLFVNATTWSLLITRRFLGTYSNASMHNSLGKVVQKGGAPLIRKSMEFAMELLGKHFVMGQTIADAISRSHDNIAKGYAHSFDMLGEAAMNTPDAQRYLAAYVDAITAIGKTATLGPITSSGISVKLSALHPRYDLTHRDKVHAELYPRLYQLAAQAAQCNMGFNIDAEEADRLELSLELLTRLVNEPSLKDWQGLGFVVQAYQKRALAVVGYLQELARNSGHRLMVRLVKGAYWDSEIKRAQIDGLPGYPVFTRKYHSDLSYLVAAAHLLDAGDALYPQFATHNVHSFAYVEEMAKEKGVNDYEFQCLHGMGEPLYDQVVEREVRVRIYAPVGRHETLLPYLVRRLLENGANSSFVNQMVDPDVPVEQLIADPVEKFLFDQGSPHPSIPLPEELYGAARKNSIGLDLGSTTISAQLSAALEKLSSRHWQAEPILAKPDISSQENISSIRNPAHRQDVVGTVRQASLDEVDQALTLAAAAQLSWRQTAPAVKASLLRKIADILFVHRHELMSLCIREAGKSWANAVGEVREAEDFCRYYAAECERLAGEAADGDGGIMVCISPWNFPLAIFVGQITAALAAGYVVVAKPAEQTPLIAAYTARLLHQAGLPNNVLQLVPGSGEIVGARLTRDMRVRGVMFTGSDEVARLIHQGLASRDVFSSSTPPILIAETGGMNAMVVDSSALPEQVVQCVISSAFDSAGQRCSALRLLCLQEDIYDSTLMLLRLAMQEQVLGDPCYLATDIGPVIEKSALDKLQAHMNKMATAGHPIFQCMVPRESGEGFFLPPTLIEIKQVADIDGEHFGPILHVLKFSPAQLATLVADINATGYGLTFGIHSRIDEFITTLSRSVRAGNCYVNRNMIGAVVGVQPFGGEGLSGTGPKAGGPLMLPRLMNLLRPDHGLVVTKPPQLAPNLAALTSLENWAQKSGHTQLQKLCVAHQAASLLGAEIVLPGPTGEDNRVSFRPRGRIGCIADDLISLLAHLSAVLVTGNRAFFSADAQALLQPLSLPSIVHEQIGKYDCLDEVEACLFQGDDKKAAELMRKLANCGGALRPLIVVQNTDYPLYQLLSEHTVSINTTAAGGNTTLLMTTAA